MFSNAFEALLFVEFNFVLKSQSSNSCVISGQKIIPPFYPSLTYFGKFLPEMGKPFAFFIHRFHRYFFIKASLMIDGGK
jgi:hypothetical protein